MLTHSLEPFLLLASSFLSLSAKPTKEEEEGNGDNGEEEEEGMGVR